MPENPAPSSSDPAIGERLARLEARLSRLEACLSDPAVQVQLLPSPAALAPAFSAPRQGADELEFEVGQNWFARAGIVVLTLGVGSMLLLPYASFPAIAPSLFGFGAAAGLFGLATIWRRTFELVSSYLRGAGMALLYFATWRLFFPAARHAIDIDSVAGHGVLVAVVAVNTAIAIRRKSPWLFGLSLLMGCVTTLAIGNAGFVLGAVVAIAAMAVIGGRVVGWPGMLVAGMPLSYLTYFCWAMGNPFRNGSIHFVAEPSGAALIVLVCLGLFAAGSLWRPVRAAEDATSNTAALVNCALGYFVFAVHTAAVSGTAFVPAHAAAFVALLGIAVLFWRREHSRVATFFYAMTGYVALSMAIVKATSAPNVFVWLSLQSLVVVTTAISFRSRFIIVANFFIYLIIVLGYVVLVERETGISIGFGIVALLSARILNWQKNRLELKTELMRNAYLVSAFAVFPYSLYHLVPARYVGLAWIGLAAIYYSLNLIVQNRKYRWMGHTTLLLTTLYLAIVGTRQFEPVYRIISFLVLGTVLLIVSLAFTRMRRRQRATEAVAASISRDSANSSPPDEAPTGAGLS
jgi:hypothetical protein